MDRTHIYALNVPFNPPFRQLNGLRVQMFEWPFTTLNGLPFKRLNGQSHERKCGLGEYFCGLSSQSIGQKEHKTISGIHGHRTSKAPHPV